MNAGASAATGDVFIFLHADTLLPPSALQAIEHALTDPRVIAGAFRVCFNCDKLAYRIVAFATNMRSRLRHIYTVDQAYFVRASSFRTICGFPDIALMEDLAIIKRLRRLGKVVLLPHYVTTSARRHEKMDCCALFSLCGTCAHSIHSAPHPTCYDANIWMFDDLYQHYYQKIAQRYAIVYDSNRLFQRKPFLVEIDLPLITLLFRLRK